MSELRQMPAANSREGDFEVQPQTQPDNSACGQQRTEWGQVCALQVQVAPAAADGFGALVQHDAMHC